MVYVTEKGEKQFGVKVEINDTPYTIVNAEGESPVFISCEHASGNIPSRFQDLGIKKEEFSQVSDHYDKGCKEMSEHLSKELKAKCMLANYSRLVVDLNRKEDHPDIVKEKSFDYQIPGNTEVTKEEKSSRIDNYHKPYHAKLQSELQGMKEKHGKMAYINVHSFSHWVEGKDRDIDICLVHKEGDAKVNKRIIDILSRKYKVKGNAPFSGATSSIFQDYQSASDTAGITLEINDKHMQDPESIKKISEAVSYAVGQALQEEGYVANPGKVESLKKKAKYEISRLKDSALVNIPVSIAKAPLNAVKKRAKTLKGIANAAYAPIDKAKKVAMSLVEEYVLDPMEEVKQQQYSEVLETVKVK